MNKEKNMQKYKLEIIYEDECDGEFTPEEFTDLKKLMLQIFEEWEGMGWIYGGSFKPDKAGFLIRFYLDINSCHENKHILEVVNLDELNQTINIIFNSFKSGYEKKYEFTEV